MSTTTNATETNAAVVTTLTDAVDEMLQQEQGSAVEAQDEQASQANVVPTDVFKAMLTGGKKNTAKSTTKKTNQSATGAEEAPSMSTTMTSTTKQPSAKLVVPKNDMPVKQSTKGGTIVSVLPAAPEGARVSGAGSILPTAAHLSADQVLAMAAVIKAGRRAAPKATGKRESKTYDVKLTGITDLKITDAARNPVVDGVVTFPTYAGHYYHMNAVVKALKERGVKLVGNYSTGLYSGVKDGKVVMVEFCKPVSKQ